MKLIKTTITESEYQIDGDIVNELITIKYLLGFKLSENKKVKKTPIPSVTQIKREIHRFGEIFLKEGMKVLLRSNEPTPLIIGEIIGFETLNYRYNGDDAFPIVKDLKDGKEYISMSIIVPYTDELYDKISVMKPIEQYNYLSYPYSQIKEKYGVKYKTFD